VFPDTDAGPDGVVNLFSSDLSTRVGVVLVQSKVKQDLAILEALLTTNPHLVYATHADRKKAMVSEVPEKATVAEDEHEPPAKKRIKLSKPPAAKKSPPDAKKGKLPIKPPTKLPAAKNSKANKEKGNDKEKVKGEENSEGEENEGKKKSKQLAVYPSTWTVNLSAGRDTFIEYIKPCKIIVRIIFSAAGFNNAVTATIRDWNSKHLTNPILLIEPTPALFGKNLCSALAALTPKPTISEISLIQKHENLCIKTLKHTTIDP